MGLFDLCSRKKAVGQLYNQTQPVPAADVWSIGPAVAKTAMQGAMTPQADGTFTFDFPTLPASVHYITRSFGAIAVGAAPTMMRFRLDGAGVLKPNEGKTPTVRLYVQRKGDNWSAQGPYASYRFYSQPLDLGVASEYVLDNPQWRNVPGQEDAAGLAAALADPACYGFTFGGVDRDAGIENAGHGVGLVSGALRFVLLKYAIA